MKPNADSFKGLGFQGFRVLGLRVLGFWGFGVWGRFQSRCKKELGAKPRLQQVDEMLAASMNHPSIMAWAWFNEGPCTLKASTP